MPQARCSVWPRISHLFPQSRHFLVKQEFGKFLCSGKFLFGIFSYRPFLVAPQSLTVSTRISIWRNEAKTFFNENGERRTPKEITLRGSQDLGKALNVRIIVSQVILPSATNAMKETGPGFYKLVSQNPIVKQFCIMPLVFLL